VYNGHFCEAKEKKTQYNEKEYFVPCIKRIFPKNDDDSPNIPDDGLVVDVIFRGSNGENIQKIQKYTYMPLHQAAQTSFFGTSSVQNSQPPQSRGLSIFNFPERCDEAEVISYYESNNLSVELRDQYQRTILHYAIQLEFKDLLIYALNYGANINDPDMFGFTPLHLAVYLGNLDFVKILRKFGASFNIEDTNGNNPFRLAVECKQYVILNYLLKKGFSKFKVIKDRIPALHLSQVSRWLKSMDGKCTIYWRLHAIPYLPPITRLICSAAVIERPKFVHFNDKTGMYSIKIRHAAIIEKKLFPDAKKSTLNKYNRDLRAGTESNEEFMEQSYDANGSDSSDEEVTDRGKIKLSSSDPNPNYYCSKLGKSAFRKDLEVVQDKMDKVAFLGEIRPKDRSKSASKYVFQKPV
jgi:ankyrin repeat protein